MTTTAHEALVSAVETGSAIVATSFDDYMTLLSEGYAGKDVVTGDLVPTLKGRVYAARCVGWSSTGWGHDLV
jgi:hypothetical protein